MLPYNPQASGLRILLSSDLYYRVHEKLAFVNKVSYAICVTPQLQLTSPPTELENWWEIVSTLIYACTMTFDEVKLYCIAS